MRTHKEMLEALMQGKTLSNGFDTMTMNSEGQIYQTCYVTKSSNPANRINDYVPELWKVVTPTIIINDRVVAEPVRDSLSMGELYWHLDLSKCYQKRWSSMNTGFGSITDQEMLRNGLIFRNEKDADEVRKALLSLLMNR